MYEDNLRFTDFESGKTVIFNRWSFVELIKYIIMDYAGKSEADAYKLIEKSTVLTHSVRCFDDVYFFSKELPYHWAMMTAHGDYFWHCGKDVNYNEFGETYIEWKKRTMKEHGLKEPFVFVNSNICIEDV